MDKINKSDLIERISARTRIPKSDVTMMFNAAIDEMKFALENETTVALRGLGTFQQQTVKSKIGRNPRTNEQVIIPERKRIKFIPCKELHAKAQSMETTKQKK